MTNTTPKIVEPTIFDLSSPGRVGVSFPDPDVPRTELPKSMLRADLPSLNSRKWMSSDIICTSANSTTAWTVVSIHWAHAR